MADLGSPHWNHEFGVCVKHGLPSIPCPACIDDVDPDVYVVPDRIERELYPREEWIVPGGFENAPVF